MASQMASAVLDRVVADLASADRQVGFRATGSTVAFDGFLKLYQEGRDDPAQDDEDGGLLPPMAPGDPLRRGEITPEAALHRAAAPLHRGEPGAQARGARHRPALDLREHHLGAPGPQLRAPREPALRARGPRAPGHRVPGRVLRSVRPAGVHRLSGGPAGRRRRRRPATGRRCCASSGTRSAIRSTRSRSAGSPR